MSKPVNALIVDDEPHVRLYLKLLLGELGVRKFWEAADGEAAFESVGLHRPELVLLDLNLPRLDGLTVLRRMAESYPEIPVIVATSQNNLQTVVECQKLGAIGYVLKQSPRDELRRHLALAIDGLGEVETV
jgi:two-component system chemotaxis response regulator CheY